MCRHIQVGLVRAAGRIVTVGASAVPPDRPDRTGRTLLSHRAGLIIASLRLNRFHESLIDRADDGDVDADGDERRGLAGESAERRRRRRATRRGRRRRRRATRRGSESPTIRPQNRRGPLNLGLGSSATPDAPIFGAGRFLTSGTFLVAAAAKNSWPPAVTTTTDRSVTVTSEPPDR